MSEGLLVALSSKLKLNKSRATRKEENKIKKTSNDAGESKSQRCQFAVVSSYFSRQKC